MKEAIKLQGMREAYSQALVEIAEAKPEIVALTADLACITTIDKFRDQFPERFFNTGVAEQNLMGISAGLATCGFIPFATTFAVYASMRACEQVRSSIAYPRLNVKIVSSHGGLTIGKNGATHQALEDLAIMRAIPNMTVIAPADAIETKAVIKAIADFNGPVYVRLSRPKVPLVYHDDYKFNIGKAVTLKTGDDITLIATGIMVHYALAAAAILNEKGINAEVLSMPTIKPIDKEAIIRSALKTGAIVTAEEHSIIGGLGSAIAEVVVENIPVPVERIGVADVFGESGDPEALLEKYGLTAKKIVCAAEKVMAKKAKQPLLV